MQSRRHFLTALATVTTTAAWTGALSTVLGPDGATLSGHPDAPRIRGLLERHLALWEGGDRIAIDEMRATNPEWDFMGRSFLGLALLNAALRKPSEAPRFLAAVDRMLEDTLRTVESRGALHYLLGYARSAPFRNRLQRSLFVDGELLALLAARQHVAPDGRWLTAQAAYANHVRTHLDESPLGHGESYPDECWSFCNAFAVAGLVLDQRTRNTDHRAALERYLMTLKTHLIDDTTGLVVSEYSFEGAHQDGPEGSSIFLTASQLVQVDPDLAERQYQLARYHLIDGLAGFGWAREWPDSWRGPADIDSGPIIPILDASAGASGLAFVGAATFDDRHTLSQLLASLELAGFPTWEGEKLYYAASNQVGDAVLLYALLQGPLGEQTRWRSA